MMLPAYALAQNFLGNGNGGSIATGSLSTTQGNGSKVQLSTGSTTTNDCVKFDANGNTVDNGTACGAGGGGAPSGPASGQLAGSYPSPNVGAFTNSFHTSDVGTPTNPANALPKLVGSTGARTGTISNGSNSLALSGSTSILPGNWVAVHSAGSPCATNWRSAAGGNTTYTSTCVTSGFTNETATPTCDSGGSCGSTTVSYEICDIDGYGGVGECDAPFTTGATAAATQSFTNWNFLTWNWSAAQVPEAEVCKKVGSVYEPIGIALHQSFFDVGQPAIANDPDLPNCPGAASSAQQQPENLMAKVTAYNSSTHVATLSVNAANANCASVGCPVWSDDAPMINTQIFAAEAAVTFLDGNGNESNTWESVIIDPGFYTIGSQIMTGESYGGVSIRGDRAPTLFSQNISGPEVVLNGSGCAVPPSNCNRSAQAWFSGVKLLGEGSTSAVLANYPDETAIYIGNTNGTYIDDIEASDFIGYWNGVIWGDASGNTNDESGEQTSWTHVYLRNVREYVAGGAWIQFGKANTGDDVIMNNLFLKSSNQAITGSMGATFAPFYVNEFDPTVHVLRLQIPANALNVVHIANTQRGSLSGLYVQTASAVTGAIVVLDNCTGFTDSDNLFNMSSLSGVPSTIAFENTSSNDTIISPSVYHASSLTNSIDFSQDGSSCIGNTLIGGFGNASSGTVPAVIHVDPTDVLPFKVTKTLSSGTGSVSNPLASADSVCPCTDTTTRSNACTATPSSGSVSITGTGTDTVIVSCQ